MTGAPYSPRPESEILTEALALLPPGWLLDRTPDGMIAALLTSFAALLAGFEAAAAAIMDEVDPRTATDTIADWERVLGRDPCAADPATLGLSQRRQIAHGRWIARGGASIAYFLGLADALGYAISIVEPRPVEAGITACGTAVAAVHGAAGAAYPCWQIGPEDLRLVWIVTIVDTPVTWFRAGGDGGEAGVDAMVRFEAVTDLECYFGRRAPAHTELVFDYGS